MRCGKVDPDGAIDPDAHLWNEANCTSPRTCARCGMAEGEKNPDNHAFEDREDGSMICWRCGKVVGADDAGGNESMDSSSESDEQAYDSQDDSSGASISGSWNSSSTDEDGSNESDYGIYSDEASGMTGVLNDEGAGIVYGDDFAGHFNEDGTGVATDGKGNWVADTDGDGEVDLISIDGGNSWMDY